MKKLLLLSCLLISLKGYSLITVSPTTYSQWVVLYKIDIIEGVESDTCILLPFEVSKNCTFKSGHDEVMRVGCSVFPSLEMAECFCEYFNIRKYKEEDL